MKIKSRIQNLAPFDKTTTVLTCTEKIVNQQYCGKKTHWEDWFWLFHKEYHTQTHTDTNQNWITRTESQGKKSKEKQQMEDWQMINRENIEQTKSILFDKKKFKPKPKFFVEFKKGNKKKNLYAHPIKMLVEGFF